MKYVEIALNVPVNQTFTYSEAPASAPSGGVDSDGANTASQGAAPDAQRKLQPAAIDAPVSVTSGGSTDNDAPQHAVPDAPATAPSGTDSDSANSSQPAAADTQRELIPKRRRRKVVSFECQAGCRAEVMFGNRRMTGIITEVRDTLPADFPLEKSKIRPILRVLDEEPLLNDEMLRLGKWLAAFYLCSIGEAFSAMIPGGKREIDALGFSMLDEDSFEERRTLSDEQSAAVQGILCGISVGSPGLSGLPNLPGSPNSPAHTNEQPAERKTQTLPGSSNSPATANEQLSEHSGIPGKHGLPDSPAYTNEQPPEHKAQTLPGSSNSPATANEQPAEHRGLPVGKPGLPGLSSSPDSPAPANAPAGERPANEPPAERKAQTLFHYLYGATGSGKTEVFLSAAEAILQQGKGVIYLVPEIALTSQVVQAVVMRFGGTAAVLHSGLTPGQKLSEWRRIIKRQARVVIGARSAVFAPVPDLGMIIIDEEHDSSYKSSNTPRYHARQVAMHRAAANKIPLVMGSATPSVEAWHAMQKKQFACHRLTKRLAGGRMPEIKCVDLSRAKLGGPSGYSSISFVLEEEIRTALKQGRQVILFLNRRGFNHIFRCQTCGFELKCKNCSVPMTYHKSKNKIICHYCGYSVEPLSVCPQCGSVDIGYMGFGTEFIENEVRAKFPSARALRLDTDSLGKKGELEQKIAAFKNGEYEILLGTQMIAKGLNFPRLKLVGVILADTSLHLPDFRASERTFSLITQVAGRAGRYFPDGKVIVQTYSPDNPAVAFACRSQPEKFYAEEIAVRRMLGFPPFSRLLRLVFRSTVEKNAAQCAAEAKRILSAQLQRMQEQRSTETAVAAQATSNAAQTEGRAAREQRGAETTGTAQRASNATQGQRGAEPAGAGQAASSAAQTEGRAAQVAESIAQKQRAPLAEILGPSECPLAKIASNYRHQLLLRAPSATILQRLAASLLFGYRVPQGVYIEADVDPVSML